MEEWTLQDWLKDRKKQLTWTILKAARDPHRSTVKGIADSTSVIGAILNSLGFPEIADKDAQKVATKYTKDINSEDDISRQAQEFNTSGIVNQAIREIAGHKTKNPGMIWQDLMTIRKELKLNPTDQVSKQQIQTWRNQGKLKHLEQFSDDQIYSLFNQVVQNKNNSNNISYLELFA